LLQLLHRLVGGGSPLSGIERGLGQPNGLDETIEVGFRSNSGSIPAVSKLDAQSGVLHDLVRGVPGHDNDRHRERLGHVGTGPNLVVAAPLLVKFATVLFENAPDFFAEPLQAPASRLTRVLA
jgi:hypothetical protein